MSEQLWMLCQHGEAKAHVDTLPCPGHFADWPPGGQMSCTVIHQLHCPGGHPVEGGDKDLLVSELERILGPAWSVVLKHKRLYREVGT